jgi:predicted dehydrogenase
MRTTGYSSRPSTSTPVRVAVVGAGAFARLHAHAFAANPDCELVAMVDRTAERARALAADVGAEAAYTTVEELLADRTIDAISVVTAGSFHLEPTVAALEAGVHVLLEKPVVMSSAEGRVLRDAADASDAFVMPAHILRFAASYRELRARVQAGSVGTVRALSFRRHRTLDHDRLFPDVHPAFMTMIHDLDLALWLTEATPAAVTARQVEAPGRAQPLAVWAEVETEEGPVFSFQVSWSLATGALPDALEVVGDAGLLSLGLAPRLTDFGTGADGTGAGPVDDALTPAGGHGALQEEIRTFVDGVRFGTVPTAVTLGEALDGIDLAERIMTEARLHPIGSAG